MCFLLEITLWILRQPFKIGGFEIEIGKKMPAVSTHCTFMESFRGLKDPRINRKKLYPLQEILLIVICATICGAESWRDFVLFGKEKLEYLRTFFPFKNGIPSKNTFARLFAALNPE